MSGINRNAPVLLIRRQSPDWTLLSNDYYHGRTIDPQRFIPDHEISGFPQNIATLIGNWNDRFAIDFFTYRAILEDLSLKSAKAVEHARVFEFADLDAIVHQTQREECFAWFHDDDDFFSPNLSHLTDSLPETQGLPDVLVTPLIKIGHKTFTFARDGLKPDYTLGKLRPHSYRYQTNNYGIHSRHLRSAAQIIALKDHIAGSAEADRLQFVDGLLPSVISATVKTPASASSLPLTLANEEAVQKHFAVFLDTLEGISLPTELEWIAKPIRTIRRVTASVLAGADYSAIEDLLDGLELRT